MANITNRNEKFLIRVFTGRDISGKQIVKSTTYVPSEGTSPKKAEKLAQEYTLLSSRGIARVMHSLTRICVFLSWLNGILRTMLPKN